MTTESAIVNRTLVEPAILVADKFCSEHALETGALRATTDSRPSNFLTVTDELDPKPFELHIEIPGAISSPYNINGTIAVLKSILDSYRSLMSIGQNL